MFQFIQTFITTNKEQAEALGISNPSNKAIGNALRKAK